jgi:IS605 OrfB family transposase
MQGRSRDSFRIRNKQHKRGAWLIRVGEGHPRSVTLPTLGQIRVHDDTRRLRRLLRSVKTSDVSTGTELGAARAKILFATITRHGNRWYVSLNIQAGNLHPERRHPVRTEEDGDRIVGVDRGLTVFAVAATAEGTEVGHFHAPRPLKRRLHRLRRRSRILSRAKRGSYNWFKAARLLAVEHARIANARRAFLHEVSSQLAKTHSRLAIEDLAVTNLVANRRLARAIADAGWAELARQLSYKEAWFGGELLVSGVSQFLLGLVTGLAGLLMPVAVGSIDADSMATVPQWPSRRCAARALIRCSVWLGVGLAGRGWPPRGAAACRTPTALAGGSHRRAHRRQVHGTARPLAVWADGRARLPAAYGD